MKITKNQLKGIIRRESQRFLRESSGQRDASELLDSASQKVEEALSELQSLRTHAVNDDADELDYDDVDAAVRHLEQAADLVSDMYSSLSKAGADEKRGGGPRQYY